MFGNVLLAAQLQEPFGPHEQALVICTFVVMLVIIFCAFLAQSGIGLVPKGWGACFEHIFDWLDEISQGFMGPEGRKYVPFAMSIFLFILISNWSGCLPWPRAVFEEPHAIHESFSDQPPPGPEGIHQEIELGWEPPTTSYSTTLALALISFSAFMLFGLHKRVLGSGDAHGGHSHDHGHDHSHDHAHDHGHGHSAGEQNPFTGLWQWISHYWAPTPTLWRTLEGATKYIVIPLFFLFLALNFIEEFARILSLSIRLYGNIFGEHQVHENLSHAIQHFTIGKGGALDLLGRGDTLGGFGSIFMAGLLWGSMVFATCLGALAGFIQAMVFAMLTLTYIAHAVADEH